MVKIQTFSQHGHVLYQIKENPECNNMVANILLAESPNTGGGAKRSIFSYYTTWPCCLSNGPWREKTCLQGFVNNKGADQPAHMRSLISAFVVRLTESIMSRHTTSEISMF